MDNRFDKKRIFLEALEEAGDIPKNAKELREQINEAIVAIKQGVDLADIKDDSITAFLSSNILWLESLLELVNIELNNNIN